MRLGLGAGPSSHQLPRGPGPESAQSFARESGQVRPRRTIYSPTKESSKIPSLTLADPFLTPEACEGEINASS